ncbi:hypothetical protein BGZ83_003686 [Gryganskiella cystojenkinii]|nr:hypothetical protein BGZ83_003686 [Gryganskiella cystojenkinii]
MTEGEVTLICGLGFVKFRRPGSTAGDHDLVLAENLEWDERHDRVKESETQAEAINATGSFTTWSTLRL